MTCTIIVDPEAASNLEQAPDPFGFSLQFEWASTLTGLAVSGKAVSIHGGFLSKSEHIGMPRMLHLHMAKLGRYANLTTLVTAKSNELKRKLLKQEVSPSAPAPGASPNKDPFVFPTPRSN